MFKLFVQYIYISIISILRFVIPNSRFVDWLIFQWFLGMAFGLVTTSVLFDGYLRPIGFSGFTYELHDDDFQCVKLERRVDKNCYGVVFGQ